MNITTLFGSTATMNTTTPSNPELRIPFASVSTNAEWNTAPTSSTTTAAKWLLSIIRQVKAAVDAISDNTNTVTVGSPTISVQTINSTVYDVYTYSVGFRVVRTGGTVPDPDNI